MQKLYKIDARHILVQVLLVGSYLSDTQRVCLKMGLGGSHLCERALTREISSLGAQK